MATTCQVRSAYNVNYSQNNFSPSDSI